MSARAKEDAEKIEVLAGFAKAKKDSAENEGDAMQAAFFAGVIDVLNSMNDRIAIIENDIGPMDSMVDWRGSPNRIS